MFSPELTIFPDFFMQSLKNNTNLVPIYMHFRAWICSSVRTSQPLAGSMGFLRPASSAEAQAKINAIRW
jgi:hypothetical protein